jgi:hypothetical protein
MPLTYTYPLRIGYTLQFKKMGPYLFIMSLIYAFLYGANMLIWLGVYAWVLGYVSTIVLFIIFSFAVVAIYIIKPEVKLL